MNFDAIDYRKLFFLNHRSGLWISAHWANLAPPKNYLWWAVLSTVYYVMLFCFEYLENLHYYDEAQFLLGSKATINVRQIFDLVNSFYEWVLSEKFPSIVVDACRIFQYGKLNFFTTTMASIKKRTRKIWLKPLLNTLYTSKTLLDAFYLIFLLVSL